MEEKFDSVASALKFLFLFIVGGFSFGLLCILYSSNFPIEMYGILGSLMLGNLICITILFSLFVLSVSKIKYTVYTSAEYEEKKIFILYKVKFQDVLGYSWHILPANSAKRTVLINIKDKRIKGSSFSSIVYAILCFIILTNPIWKMCFNLIIG